MKTSENTESAAVQHANEKYDLVIVLVAMGVFAYTEVTSRLVSLETSSELFEADLLKKSEQVAHGPGEQFMLLESLFGDVEKLIKNQEQNMTNKVNLKTQLEKALADVEQLKDKVRQNGTSHLEKLYITRRHGKES